MLHTTRLSVVLLLGLSLLTGCGGSSVTVEDPDTERHLSGRWNSSDAQRVADEMVTDVLNNWIPRYQQNNDDRPTVIVGPVDNKTMQHIDESIFISALEEELVNSGQVEFVAGGDARNAIRNEREQQQTRATMETASAMAQEIGAGYMLHGTISSNVDESLEGDEVSMFYRVNLELIDIERTTKEWIGSTEVQKFVERSKVSM